MGKISYSLLSSLWNLRNRHFCSENFLLTSRIFRCWGEKIVIKEWIRYDLKGAAIQGRWWTERRRAAYNLLTIANTILVTRLFSSFYLKNDILKLFQMVIAWMIASPAKSCFTDVWVRITEKVPVIYTTIFSQDLNGKTLFEKLIWSLWLSKDMYTYYMQYCHISTK